MPELPEVETIRRQLEPVVAGHTLTALEISDPRWCEPLEPDALVDALVGRRVEALGRRGKYMIWSTDDDAHLLLHLRMTGTLLVDPPPETKYSRVRFVLDDERELWFCDPRRFGTGELMLGAPARDRFLAARLGVEPFGDDFTADELWAQVKGRSAPIKAVLLDQRRVAGVGNIYADEALFRARIHPLRPARMLRKQQVALLRDAVVAALSAGLDAGGATIDDFRHVDGVYGGFQHEFLVHRREGEPCGTCGTTIVKFVAGGRGTYACERCQVRPRGVPSAARNGRRQASPGSRPAAPRR